MKTIKEILIERDGLTEEEADQAIEEAKEIMNNYIACGDISYAYEICEECFGLEADYIFELLD